MKKIFGNINLTWKKVIISAIIIGIYVGIVNSIPILHDTSITDIAIYFDWWILFGILIIMNSKSNKDSALKCFIFFLISQPLIYLVEVPFSRLGWQLFMYYKYWFIWTILCIPMGYIGYYLKKDKWWTIFILLPMLFLLAYGSYTYLNLTMYAFPKHIFSYLFTVASLIIFPIYTLNNKKTKIIGIIISIILIVVVTFLGLKSNPVYETEILCSGGKYNFDNTYRVNILDSEYGSVEIKEIPESDIVCVKAKFVKEGHTKIELIAPDETKRIFDLTIKRNTYDIEELS